MDFKVLLGAVMLAGLSVAGCSTKNYGRQPELTDFERQTMSCREIDLEQAKVQGFLSHVREESEFDGRSVLSFLGDFGIGNLMEKDAAVDSANQRLTQLAGAKMQRGCTYAYEAEAPAQQPYAPPRAYAPDRARISFCAFCRRPARRAEPYAIALRGVPAAIPRNYGAIKTERQGGE
ncbi:hypothetical protein P4131_17505 [Pseudomonas aeruginosa]|nr:hypothetical protein [Pseudomonas aeruginosa]